MKSFPFTSKVEYDSQGKPTYDRAVTSDILRNIFKNYFTNGVFYQQGSNFQVLVNSEMKINVNSGSCVINGATAYEEITRTFTLTSGSSQPRIDTIVLRLNESVDYRNIELYVLTGVPSEVPEIPTLTRSEDIYELGIANILVPAYATEIVQENITDTRSDSTRCGYVLPILEFDTTTMFTQIQSAMTSFNEYREDFQTEEFDEFTTWLEGVQSQFYNKVQVITQEAYDELPESEKSVNIYTINLDDAHVKMMAYGKEVVKEIASVSEYILYPNMWQGENAPYTYNLGIDSTKYDIEILLKNTATSDMVDAITSAVICGNGDDNILRAFGEKPNIQIPIVVKREVKQW